MQNAVIRFETEGYDLTRPALMGRHAAGAAFLRAAVAARGDEPVMGYGPRPGTAGAFDAFVKAIDPGARTGWISFSHLGALGNRGVCFLPQPALGLEAGLRLRLGVTRFSLCGITHTTATEKAMAAIAGLLTEPVMPWDAVICTSDAVAETVRRVHEAQAEYLRWRLGGQVRLSAPQLPVIPLGVHCDDFVFSDAERSAARTELGLGPDDVAALFVGRLTFIGKAHPLQMYQALQTAAERTSRKPALIHCGWSPTPQITGVFERGAATFAPAVRSMFVDGRDPAARRRCWAAADLFVSLSDNIQETFGLTPLEAMAAGLPVVVSDWNGYRQTVQDGVHGFRVRSWAPGAGAGTPLAAAFEAGALDYDRFCWATVAATSLDLAELTDRLAALIDNPDLRRRMGEAGRATARADFDWKPIFARYQALWGKLNARRRAAMDGADEQAWVADAPRQAAARLDPFVAFGHYPTAQLNPNTRVTLAPGADKDLFLIIARNDLFIGARPSSERTAAVLARLRAGPASVRDCAEAAGEADASLLVGALAKMGLVRLDPA